MPPRPAEQPLEVLLRHCYLSRSCQPKAAYRCFSGTARRKKDYAVVGGGITGLSTAYYLVKKVPGAKVTLFESSPRLGGWMRSKFVDLASGKKILFEEGPRTLRTSTPNGYLTLQLIRDLSLKDQMITIPSYSHASQNRFVYYPDHLVRIPGPPDTIWSALSTILSEPVFSGLIRAAFRDLTVPKRSAELQDESVGSFFERRGDERVAENLVSAVIHGIYAGDIWKLSMRNLLPFAWFLEARDRSFILGLPMSRAGFDMPESNALLLREIQRQELRAPPEKRIDTTVGVYGFKKGICQLSDALEAFLRKAPNVRIKKSTDVYKAGLTEGNQVELHMSSKADNRKYKQTFASVISAASPSSTFGLDKIIPDLQVPAVTVMVVNLYFTSPNLLPVRGFGYLIPRSVPYYENPERALGVIFDSDAIQGQDDVPGTKVTVMLGGHWWDGWPAYPDEEQGARMARDVLARHLKITDEPTLVNVSLQRDCIPQYHVGHDMRMHRAHKALVEKFKGAVKVAGNSYKGVGVNDCIRSAYDVVEGIANGRSGTTGLENFSENFYDEPWVKVLVLGQPAESPD